MKRLLPLIIALFTVQMAFTQVTKLKANAFAIRSLSEYNGWSDWSDWSDCNILCVFDIANDRITIYSSENQVYDIIVSHDGYYDSDGDYLWILEAIDKNGSKCKLKLITRNVSQRVEMYINYSDMQWVYNVNFMD